MKEVLILGGAGFIRNFNCRNFLKGDNVILLLLIISRGKWIVR